MGFKNKEIERKYMKKYRFVNKEKIAKNRIKNKDKINSNVRLLKQSLKVQYLDDFVNYFKCGDTNE